MDKTLRSGKVALDKKFKDGTSKKQQPRDVKMEERATDSSSWNAKPDQTNAELSVRREPDSVAENLCTVCGFSAKCPRSLKIHSAKRHGNRSKNAGNTAKSTENISDASSVDVNQEAGDGAVNQIKKSKKSDELSVSSDDSSKTKSSSEKETEVDKQQTNQEEMTQKRRVSKRTPKPKIIHSCNYCGQEFWGKSPLDLHVQRSHAKDTPYTFDKDDDMDSEEDPKDTGISEKTSPTRVVTKHTLSRFQLKCTDCEFAVGTVALLENHARVKHLGQQWFRCKLCNFFSATSNWMEAHLSSDHHKQQEKGERSPGLSAFEFYVENTNQELSEQGAVFDDIVQVEEDGYIAASLKRDLGTDESAEAAVEEEELELAPPKKKRGRPKLGSTTTCGYCGLVVSNATNLSVHVRRKHSKEYGYSCTLCNYSCVTKGDMDRHCITKKHVTRVQGCANKNLVNNGTSESKEEATGTQVQESQKDQEPDVISPTECSEDELAQTDTSQSRSNINACSHCHFVAQSLSSLQLHVKRKHTKDFEYVCMACSYYAVTSREMSRHVNTEKHKQKSQKYLDQLGSEGQRTLALPSKMKEVVGVEGPKAELETPEAADERKSCSSDPQVTDTTAAPVPIQTGDIVAVLVGSTDKKLDENLASVSDGDPDPAASEPQQTPAESAMEQSAEHAVEEADQTEDEDCDEDGVSLEAEGDGLHSDAQLSKAPAFDGCIVSMKSFAVQEKMLQEGLALEGEAAVVCLTGGSPVPASYVRKLKQPKAKVREEAKTGSSHIRCDDCGFMADGVSGLNVHISMKHPSKEKHFHCLVCGKSFYTDSNLHQHLTSAAHLRNEQNSVEELPEGGASFKCVKCTDRFETEQDLFVHIKEKHEELLREVNKYVLEDTEQINREREENQGSVCKYCGKVCKSSNSMAFLAHIRTHTGSKPFMCKICNFATAQLGDARNHVKRHLGMREYKCDICGWAFVMKKHLSTHLLGKHGIGQRKERKYECDLCERTFSEKWALNNHKKLHSGEKPYKCAWPSCHYSFLNLSAMKDHYRTHTGEKSYLCDMCGFAGGTRHALTKHRRQHTGERPFKCKFCNFASTTQSHLSRHKRVHTGEKPYRCPWCDYRSNCAENIRKHILHTGKHEGVKMYNCPKCTFGTNSPMEFRNHLKEHHSDIENPDLAYLHAGIVSKSFECRLKGQGAAYVEVEAVEPQGGRKAEGSGHQEPVQQVIIIQGYGDGEVAIDQALEESAAATLQTLAMAGQVAEVLHITEDGQVIASGREVAAAGAHLAGGGAQYVVLESGEVRGGLQTMGEGTASAATAGGQSHMVAESSTALDALLSAVQMGHQEEVQGEAAVVHQVLTAEMAEGAQKDVKEEQEEQTEVQIIHEGSQQEMQEVLHLAASQMMKEGLTQVIVNDEGTHYIVTELDNCTLQVEGDVYTEAEARAAQMQQAEPQPGGEMVVYLDGANHNIVLEG